MSTEFLSRSASAYAQHYPFDAVVGLEDSPFNDLPERILSRRQRLAVAHLESQIAKQTAETERKANAPSFLSLLKSRKSASSATDDSQSETSESAAKEAALVDSSRHIPTAEEFAIARKVPILDAEGHEVDFGSVIQSRGKTVVIFIRHWWDAISTQYIQDLAKVPKTSYTRKHIKVVIIGCGPHELIPAYQKITDCDILLYTETTGRLHDALKMNKAVDPVKPKEKGDFLKKSIAKNFRDSNKPINTPGLGPLPVKEMAMQSQLGGEFCFQRTGHQIDCIFASRMTNLRIHGPLKAVFASAGADVRRCHSLEEEEL